MIFDVTACSTLVEEKYHVRVDEEFNYFRYIYSFNFDVYFIFVLLIHHIHIKHANKINIKPCSLENKSFALQFVTLTFLTFSDLVRP